MDMERSPSLETPSVPTRTLIVICLSAAGWAFGFGLGAPLASLWLKEYGTTVVGLNTGIYYLGIALAATVVPWLMRRLGRGCPAIGMVVSGLAVAAFPWGGSLASWFVLRLLHGVAGAMSLIPVESLTNSSSPPAHRARNFGFYAFSVALGWALGTLVGMEMYASAPRSAFLLGGCVSVLAGVILGIALPASARFVEERRRSDRVQLLDNFPSFGAGWSQGFLEGGMVSLLPIYLLALGFSDNGVGRLTSGIMIGVIVFQVPVAWLADRLGRTPVLLGCYGVVVAGLACLPFCAASVWLALWLFLVGACSGAFYPLGLAVLGERVPRSALPRASACYLGVNCIGCLVGPAVTGVAMDSFGNGAMFLTGEAAILLVLMTWAAMRVRLWLRAERKPGAMIHALPVESRDAA